MYKTKAVLKDEILEVLADADEKLTAEDISKEVGYSKLSSRVADAVVELITDGEVETGTSGDQVTYALNGGPDSEAIEDDVGTEMEEDSPVESNRSTDPEEITEVTLPEQTNGYNIELLEKNHVRVTFPDETEGEAKVVVLEPNERLLVINQDEQFRFIVSSPEHLLQAIHTYTAEQGITTYLVTDMATGNAVPDVSDIDMKVAIIFIEISRHNKAGL